MSDAPGDRYRLYEIAGAPHADASFYPYMPTVADQKKTGFDAFLNSWRWLTESDGRKIKAEVVVPPTSSR